MKRRTRIAAIPAALAAAAGGVGFLTTQPASAHNANYIWGDNEDQLSTTAVNQGNIVGMWQSLLNSYAAHITTDGYFGSQTAGAVLAYDQEFSISPANSIVEDGANQTWNNMGNLQLVNDGCDSSYCYYHLGAQPVSPRTSLAMNRSTLNWKWRGDCITGTNWHDSNHPTIDFTGQSC